MTVSAERETVDCQQYSEQWALEMLAPSGLMTGKVPRNSFPILAGES